ncbi:MAG: alpha-hydroxy acid oxidase [Rhodospirillales bacterium]|nr:alpha-hydroxy acid oxidase [Rhodospirillales bacterium]
MVDIAKLDAIGGEYQCLHELVAAARARLPDHSWDYLVGGTETETTLRRNRAALDSIAFRPRVLRDVSRVEAAGPILGTLARLPVFLAPVGSLDSFDSGGAATAARAAALFGVPIMVSSVTKPGLEATAEAGPARRFFQLYRRGDDAYTDDFVRRAAANGYETFCFTVDSAVYSRRERDITRRFAKPWRRGGAGMQFQAALNWTDIKRYKENHALPLIIKGIATPEDAAIAIEHGVEVIYVSNHGGRQLDHGAGSLDGLPEIVSAVAGRARIFVDGGFCRGTDIVKALALGAEAVGIGRLYCYGLAAAGEAGVIRVLELLEIEMVECLALLGITTPAALDRSHVRAAQPVSVPGVHSAFPLLNLPR